MRAPFAPPRLSPPRKVEAAAQAVVTNTVFHKRVLACSPGPPYAILGKTGRGNQEEQRVPNECTHHLNFSKDSHELQKETGYGKKGVRKREATPENFRGGFSYPHV